MKIFLKSDLKGGKQWRYAISHASYACFQTNLSLGKTAWEVWSQVCGKIAMLVYKVTFEKSAKM